jgi:hypothetical protein
MSATLKTKTEIQRKSGKLQEQIGGLNKFKNEKNEKRNKTDSEEKENQ